VGEAIAVVHARLFLGVKGLSVSAGRSAQTLRSFADGLANASNRP
jgi:hypothetical protein